jgi:outer membrane lipoprotein carrier protein
MLIFPPRLLNAKRNFLLFCTLIFSYNAMAETIDASLHLKQKLANLQSFEANFIQKVSDIDNQLLQEADGNIALKQPNKLYWELNEPNENVLIADGLSLWHIDPFVEQVVALQQDLAIENNPLILLTDPSSEAWHNFEVSEQDNVFTVTAKKIDVSIVKLMLRFSHDQLVELSMEDSQQQTSQLVFSDIRQNQDLDDSRFVFSMPMGYELDDQRTQ